MRGEAAAEPLTTPNAPISACIFGVVRSCEGEGGSSQLPVQNCQVFGFGAPPSGFCDFSGLVNVSCCLAPFGGSWRGLPVSEALFVAGPEICDPPPRPPPPALDLHLANFTGAG